MNIAIVGSSGYIARFIIDNLQKEKSAGKVLKIDQTTDSDIMLNLLLPEKFDYEALNGIDYIIFTAAVSGPDQCASEYEFCKRINVDGTKYFIRKALEKKCRVLFFSSDAVYGDIDGKIYTETTQTAALTPYGRMKKEIEDNFISNKDFKALRLSYVVSAKDRFVKYCTECIRNNTVAEIYHPFYRNCTTVSDVVITVVWLCRHWEEYAHPVLNVAGPELVSRVRIADELNRIYGGALKYRIITPEASFYKNRPKITQMKSLYIEKYNILENKSFTEKLKAELEDYIYE